MTTEQEIDIIAALRTLDNVRIQNLARADKAEKRIAKALEALSDGQIDGAHHKTWARRRPICGLAHESW